MVRLMMCEERLKLSIINRERIDFDNAKGIIRTAKRMIKQNGANALIVEVKKQFGQTKEH